MSIATTVTIPAEDAVEILEALQWLREWFIDDPEQLAARSLRRFSYGLFSLGELAEDLDRYASILGARP